MGMYDSMTPGSLEGSSAQMALLLQAPVALVVDAGGMAGSLAAMAQGYDRYGGGNNVSGVIANRVGSADHAELLKNALRLGSAPPLVGAVGKGALPPLARRHLGLVTAEDQAATRQILEQMADAVEAAVDLEALMALAKNAPPLPAPSAGAEAPAKPLARLGLASDSAFHFYYPDNLAALEAAGLAIERFSPISDKRLPKGLDAIYFGGGYPEEFAGELSENLSMLEDVREFISSGRPVYAECGGLIYLSRGVEDRQGRRYPLVGKLASWTRMLDRFRALGYVEATLTRPSLFGETGATLRGHRFHYSELLEDPAAAPDWAPAYRLVRARTGQQADEGYQCGRALASYAHIHFASAPGAAEKFAERILEVKAL